MTKLFAKRLRQKSTDAERLIWRHLKSHQAGFKFRRQYLIAPYVVDFVCLAKNLIIELDGGHHTAENDADRTAFLESKGFVVTRYWNNQVLQETEAVLYDIYRHLH